MKSPEELKKEVADRLGKALVRRDLNQRKVSEKINLPRNKIKHWLHPEDDSREIKAYDLFVLCKELDLSADWLLGLRPESGDDRVSAPATDDLGLTQKAIDRIKNFTLGGGTIRPDVLSRFLEDKDIAIVFYQLSNFINIKEELNNNDGRYSDLSDDELTKVMDDAGLDEAIETIERFEMRAVNKSDVAEFTLWDAARAFEDIARRI